MGLRIGIVELEQHAEVLAYLVQVLRELGEVSLYVSASLSVPENAKIHRCEAKSRHGRKQFLRKHVRELQSADLIVVTTVGLEADWLTTLLDIGQPVVVVVHNVNFELGGEGQGARHLVDAFRRVKWTLQNRWPRRKLPTERLAGLVFASSSMAHRAQELGYFGPSLALPWAVTHPPILVSPSNPRLRIVIPGTVRDQDRRWHPVYGAFAKTSIACDVELAGSLRQKQGAAIAKKLLANLPPDSQLIAHHQPLSAELYEAALQRADVLLLPLAREMNYATVAETGGVSKVSGAEHDQLRHGKWALVDTAYRGNPALEGMQLGYGSPEKLAELIALFPRTDPPPLPSAGYLKTHLIAWQHFIDKIC